MIAKRLPVIVLLLGLGLAMSIDRAKPAPTHGRQPPVLRHSLP